MPSIDKGGGAADRPERRDQHERPGRDRKLTEEEIQEQLDRDEAIARAGPRLPSLEERRARRRAEGREPTEAQRAEMEATYGRSYEELQQIGEASPQQQEQSIMEYLDRFKDASDVGRPKTRGLWMDGQGRWSEVASGADELAETTRSVLRDRGFPKLMIENHVETKVAAYMATNGIEHLRLVVNKKMCEGPRSCTDVIPKILPVGSRLDVEDPTGKHDPLRGQEER